MSKTQKPKKEKIEKSKAKKILITHGTYTMPDTAFRLVRRVSPKK